MQEKEEEIGNKAETLLLLATIEGLESPDEGRDEAVASIRSEHVENLVYDQPRLKSYAFFRSTRFLQFGMRCLFCKMTGVLLISKSWWIT